MKNSILTVLVAFTLFSCNKDEVVIDPDTGETEELVCSEVATKDDVLGLYTIDGQPTLIFEFTSHN